MTKIYRKCFIMSIISKVLYRTMISAGGILEKKFNKYTLNSKSVHEEV